MTAIIIFDIDLTLIHTTGAGRRAMSRSFAHLFGVEDAFASVDFAGRTDRSILRDCFSTHAMLDDRYDARSQQFQGVYLELLAKELEADAGLVLPGVEAVLEVLSTRPGVRLGLGTGNFRAAAELKLRRHGLWSYFVDGGFADDSEDRAEVIATAIRRLRGNEEPDARILVVGDTPHDVAAARANGAVAIAVATGRSSREILEAAGADYVLDTLHDLGPLLEALIPE
jgi:phosphoglycolate phosphatase